jgi:tetratricopeptide (TPR) repeat protein
MIDGNRRRGKKLFARSVTDPTGNSLAQAEWASLYFGEHFIGSEQIQRTCDAHEARALHLGRNGEFEQALLAAQEWIAEEPFSSRAYLTASAAANMMESYSLAESLARRGLEYNAVNPLARPLQNNRAFSLACLGKLEEAEELINRTLQPDQKDQSTYVAYANRGLIALRRGHHATGIDCYKTAIAGFKRLELNQLERLARAYFAYEAARARLSEAAKLIEQCKKDNVRPIFPDTALIVARAKILFDPMSFAAEAAKSLQQSNMI